MSFVYYQRLSQVLLATVMTWNSTDRACEVSKDINRELETIVMSPLQEMPWAVSGWLVPIQDQLERPHHWWHFMAGNGLVKPFEVSLSQRFSVEIRDPASDKLPNFVMAHVRTSSSTTTCFPTLETLDKISASMLRPERLSAVKWDACFVCWLWTCI